MDLWSVFRATDLEVHSMGRAGEPGARAASLPRLPLRLDQIVEFLRGRLPLAVPGFCDRGVEGFPGRARKLAGVAQPLQFAGASLQPGRLLRRDRGPQRVDG